MIFLTDRLAHAWAGMLLSLCTLSVCEQAGWGGYGVRVAVGLGTAIVAGIAKELFDRSQGEDFDWADFLYTFSGGFVQTGFLLTVWS